MQKPHDKTEIFLEYRPFLFSVAYNMVGIVADAEDIVEDTYEKWLMLDASTVQHSGLQNKICVGK